MSTFSVPLIVRRSIAGATASLIYSAFENPVSLSQWFVSTSEVKVEVLTCEFVVGGRYRLRYTMHDERVVFVSGVYEAIDEPTGSFHPGCEKPQIR